MHFALRLSLGFTLALTAAALLWPAKPMTVVAAARRPVSSEIEAGARVATGVRLPEELPPKEFESGRRDPFAPVSVPVPSTVVVPQMASTAPVRSPSMPDEPSPPAPPAVRYFGSIVTPEGKRITLMAAGERTLTVQPGMVLEGGYVVQSMSSTVVSFVYPPTGTRFDVAIPDPDAKAR